MIDWPSLLRARNTMPIGSFAGVDMMMFSFFGNKKNTREKLLREIADRYIEDFKNIIDEVRISEGVDRIVNDKERLSWDTILLTNYGMAVSEIVVVEYYLQLKNDYHIYVQKDCYEIENRERFDSVLNKVISKIALPLLTSKVNIAVNSLVSVSRKEKDDFFNMYNSDHFYKIGIFPLLFNSIDIFLRKKIDLDCCNNDKDLIFEYINTGIGYEYAIAKLINDYVSGWRAEVSAGSGDQGLDVMATRDDGTTVAIQAKYYTNTVGNKAVQEVIAARGYYKTKYAVVVSNSSFSKSAYDLALANNVELIHHLSLLDYLNNIGQIRKSTIV